MKNSLPKPIKNSIIYEDDKLYCCLASFPITKGHTVVVWKKSVPDLNKLHRKDYDWLMDKVDEIRNALIKTFKTKKVYLIYMDETNQVHWHLVPRYNEKGFNMLTHKPRKLKNTDIAKKIKKNLILKLPN